MVGQNSAGARGVPFWVRGFELLLSGDVRLAWGLLLLSWGIVLVATVTCHGNWLHADPLTEHPSWPLAVNLLTFVAAWLVMTIAMMLPTTNLVGVKMHNCGRHRLNASQATKLRSSQPMQLSRTNRVIVLSCQIAGWIVEMMISSASVRAAKFSIPAFTVLGLPTIWFDRVTVRIRLLSGRTLGARKNRCLGAG